MHSAHHLTGFKCVCEQSTHKNIVESNAEKWTRKLLHGRASWGHFEVKRLSVCAMQTQYRQPKWKSIVWASYSFALEVELHAATAYHIVYRRAAVNKYCVLCSVCARRATSPSTRLLLHFIHRTEHIFRRKRLQRFFLAAKLTEWSVNQVNVYWSGKSGWRDRGGGKEKDWIWTYGVSVTDTQTKLFEHFTPFRKSARLWQNSLKPYGLTPKAVCLLSNA